MIECVLVSQRFQQPLAFFFERLRNTTSHFHPHPFTAEEAEKRAAYAGEDLYYLLIDGERVLGYGMLRGWDEGYTRPSLGIATDPDERGKGYGELLMRFLHAAARQKGAVQIRLKVYPDNTRALALYRKLGYEFSGKEAGQFVGYFKL